MTQDVYADLLFLINFSMDYLCLYICLRVLHRPIRLGRTVLAAAVGGIYSVLSLLFALDPMPALLLDIAACLVICFIAFTEKGRKIGSVLLCTFLYFGISMMLGGCMTAIFNLLNRLDLPLDGIAEDGISAYLFAILAAIAGIISLRSGQLISKRAAVHECMLTLKLHGQSLTVSGFVDTGNLIKDPLGGRPVVLIDRDALSKITDLSLFDTFAQGKIPPMPASSRKMIFRIIPIHTAGGESLLVATAPDSLVISYEKRKKNLSLEVDALIAPSNIKKSADGYDAILPAVLLKNIE